MTEAELADMERRVSEARKAIERINAIKAVIGRLESPAAFTAEQRDTLVRFATLVCLPTMDYKTLTTMCRQAFEALLPIAEDELLAV